MPLFLSMVRTRYLGLVLFLAGSSNAWGAVSLTPAFDGMRFERPISMLSDPLDPNAFYVVEQGGVVYRISGSREGYSRESVLDLSAKISTRHNEEGLLSVAFHPGYEKNRHLFVYYSASNPRRTVLARFTADLAPSVRINSGSEQVILEIDQPYGNHNGATILFGPDGALYVSVGDGGAAGDPHEHGQNLATLLGTILRVQVGVGKRATYSIPPDNPFVGIKNARPEIWAYGLRNVWRMSFDRNSGALWAGDVGQNAWEEIDIIVRGGNYGWNAREGKHVYARFGMKAKAPRGESPIAPVHEYNHSLGQSITGGYVYRGRKMKRLEGVYVYADYVSGTIWGLQYDGVQMTAHTTLLEQPRNIASFAEDSSGELYVLCFDGVIYHIQAK